MQSLRVWLPALAAIAGIALTSALGVWQLGRGNEKAAQAEQLKSAQNGPRIAISAGEIEAKDLAWRHVEVNGRFVAEHTIYIDNRVMNGVVGYHVVTPLKIEGGERHVLINRGWVAAAADRRALPSIETPNGLVHLTGFAVVPSPNQYELSTQVTDGKRWQNLTIERYRSLVPISIQPVVVQQENDLNDGLKREWTLSAPSPDRNYGYAFQWFALAVTILIYYLVTHGRKSAAK